jgi:hypothetical protein
MAQDQLHTFLQEKKQRARPANIDWGAKRDAWIEAVDDLYRTIEDEYLKDAKADVEITRRGNEVREFLIGVYEIQELVLRVGDEEVVFSPQGANIVGAQGRIDIEGERGVASIVWQGGDRWGIVVSRTPALRLVDLTAESLAEILKGIMRP